MSLAVHDNPERNRYEASVEGRLAFANYRVVGDTVAILHTEIPPELNGRGLGTELVKGVLDLIRANGRKVAPRCSFAAVVIAHHPEYRVLLA